MSDGYQPLATHYELQPMDFSTTNYYSPYAFAQQPQDTNVPPPYAQQTLPPMAYIPTIGYPSGGNQPQIMQTVAYSLKPFSNPQPQNNWSNSLCGCKTCGLCCYAWSCLVCLSHENSHRLDGGGDEGCVSLCYPGGFFKNRMQAKKIFGIKETGCESCCIVSMCTPCSEMQISQELDARINTAPGYSTI